jgi:hypothetical protein
MNKPEIAGMAPFFIAPRRWADMFSILWRDIRLPVWTLLVVQVGFSVLLRREPSDANSVEFLFVSALWYGSPAQAPGISLFDAMMYAWAAYRAARHSSLVTTGILAGATTSFIGCAVLFIAIAIGSPQLLLAPFAQPFIFVIVTVLVVIAVAYGSLFGLLGGLIGSCVTAAGRPIYVHSDSLGRRR